MSVSKGARGEGEGIRGLGGVVLVYLPTCLFGAICGLTDAMGSLAYEYAYLAGNHYGGVSLLFSLFFFARD